MAAVSLRLVQRRARGPVPWRDHDAACVFKSLGPSTAAALAHPFAVAVGWEVKETAVTCCSQKQTLRLLVESRRAPGWLSAPVQHQPDLQQVCEQQEDQWLHHPVGEGPLDVAHGAGTARASHSEPSPAAACTSRSFGAVLFSQSSGPWLCLSLYFTNTVVYFVCVCFCSEMIHFS